MSELIDKNIPIDDGQWTLYRKTFYKREFDYYIKRDLMTIEDAINVRDSFITIELNMLKNN